MKTLISLWLLTACVSGAAQLGYHATWYANYPLESVTNYSIYMRGSATNTWQTNYNCGTNTQCLIYFTDKTPGSVTYPKFAAPWSSTNRPPVVVFAATAANSAGESDFSDTVTATNQPQKIRGLQIEIITAESSATIGFDPVPDLARVDSSVDLIDWREVYLVQTFDPAMRPRRLGWQVAVEGRPAGFWRMVDLAR